MTETSSITGLHREGGAPGAHPQGWSWNNHPCPPPEVLCDRHLQAWEQFTVGGAGPGEQTIDPSAISGNGSVTATKCLVQMTFHGDEDAYQPGKRGFEFPVI